MGGSCSGTVGVGLKGIELYVVCIARQDKQERTNEEMRKVLEKKTWCMTRKGI
jgi:hypothetical protein